MITLMLVLTERYGRATRHTYDVPRGIIYQGAEVTGILKEDVNQCAITVSVFSIMHRRPGESQIRGLEVYDDLSPFENLSREIGSKCR